MCVVYMFMCVCKYMCMHVRTEATVSLGWHSWVGVLQELPTGTHRLGYAAWLLTEPQGSAHLPASPALRLWTTARLGCFFAVIFLHEFWVLNSGPNALKGGSTFPTYWAISPTHFSVLFLNEEHIFLFRSHYFCEISAPRNSVKHRWIF